MEYTIFLLYAAGGQVSTSSLRREEVEGKEEGGIDLKIIDFLFSWYFGKHRFQSMSER